MFDANYGPVHAFAARRMGRDLADEISAETFLVAWQRLDVVPVEPLPWLYGVARNVVLRELRVKARQDETRELLARERTAADWPDDGEHDDVWRAWECLSEPDREVLALTAWEELKVRDAAIVLGVPASVFSVRLHRARRRFESHLGQLVSAGTSSIREAT